MIAAAKGLLLRALRVPPEPAMPRGSEGSLRVFRAAPNYLRYRLVLWGLAQIGSLAGLVFFDGFILRQLRIRDELPDFVSTGLFGLLGFAVAAFVISFVVTGLMVLLDYDLRWYLITDESLRIREGTWQVREMTMTFANIQNISIEQGPLQRLLGVADLKVKSAGGGGGIQSGGNPDQIGLDMHVGFFRGIDNADELRDLMRRRLRRAKGAGLGDPEDRLSIANPVAVETTHDSGAPRLPEDQAASPDGMGAVLADLRGQARALRLSAERWAGRA